MLNVKKLKVTVDDDGIYLSDCNKKKADLLPKEERKRLNMLVQSKKLKFR